jgi:hypothetical protein
MLVKTPAIHERARSTIQVQDPKPTGALLHDRVSSRHYGVVQLDVHFLAAPEYQPFAKWKAVHRLFCVDHRAGSA